MKFIAFATCLIGLTATPRLIECCSGPPRPPPGPPSPTYTPTNKPTNKPTYKPTYKPTNTPTTNGGSCKTDTANVKIFDCKDLPNKFTDMTISQQAANTLKNKGYSKCVLPFGVLVAGKSNFEDSGILTTAKIVAELIDQDRDGKVVKS